MKAKRQAKIIDLISRYDITTQEELLKKLQEEGFAVTQATISRDIKELRLVKTLAPDGKYRYSTGKNSETDMSGKFHSLFSDSVRSVDCAGNIVAVKCYVGMAQAVCAALDSMHWDGIVGTLAGDDTIFILTRTENTAVNLVGELRKLQS